MANIDPPASDQSPSTHSDSDPCLDLVSDLELQRTKIRQRWELASALNFLHVFKDVIGNELKVSGEEIENGLITPNDNLAKVHIALLKGIPPVNKNLTNGDAWVSIVCRKLVEWWPWVAEGDIPLEVDQGKEIEIYKTFDPVNRVVILKALCEVRAQQDDVPRYITDELKKGTNITTFCKEKIGSASNAVSYWYDQDSIMGHRLYKEFSQVESKTAKGRITQRTQPQRNYQWETVAAKLGEFIKLSESLSSSEVNAEVALSDIIKTDIVPVLQDIQKKKEIALKRQQNRALRLNHLNNNLVNQVGLTRSCRERRPVRYTFDEFDRTIDEAIHLSKKMKPTRSNKENVKQVENASGQQVDSDKSDSEPEEIHDSHTDSDDEDDADYDGSEDDTKHASGKNDFNEENTDSEEEDEDGEEDEDEEDTDQYSSKKDKEQEISKINDGFKKKLRQRLTRNSARIVSDSEESSQEDEKMAETSSDSKNED